MIPYGRHDVDEADIAAVVEVLRGDWLTTGPAVEQFEEDLKAWTGGVPVVAVSSGTAALHTAYAAAGIGPGDEVITPPITFIATQATAVMLGATIVFADVQADTANIDPDAAEAAITSRTKAIVAVDYAGHPADMDELRVIADRHGLMLIEDAAHSLGSTYRGRPVGSLADITAFSFFPTKNITTAEGGAVAVKDPQMLMKAREFARQGLVRDPTRHVITGEGPWHQEVHSFGLNYRLPDVLAALGSRQLERLGEFKRRRAAIKATYEHMLVTTEHVALPVQRDYVKPTWHLYPVRVLNGRRHEVFVRLREGGIGVQVNYLPAYRHPAFGSYGFFPEAYPNAEGFYREEISLPMHTDLDAEDLNNIANLIKRAVIVQGR